MRAVNGLAQAWAAPSMELSMAAPAKCAPSNIRPHGSTSPDGSRTDSKLGSRRRQASLENIAETGFLRVVTKLSRA